MLRHKPVYFINTYKALIQVAEGFQDRKSALINKSEMESKVTLPNTQKQ